MNMGHFQRLCVQRVKGEKTELECLREMREALAVSETEDQHQTEHKKVFQFFYDRLIDVLEVHHLSERELLTNQIEDWLSCPALKVNEHSLIE